MRMTQGPAGTNIVSREEREGSVTLVLVQVAVEVVEVVEVAEHEGGVRGQTAGLVLQLVTVGDVDEVRHAVVPLPPGPVDLVAPHHQLDGLLQEPL